MSSEAATQLLTLWLDNADLTDNSQDVSRLLSALTYLPLAITQAIAYINANDITLAHYLSLLEEKEEDVIEVLSEDFEDYGRYQDIKNPIATTWLVSFEQIRQSNPLAVKYLSFMACIGLRDIPVSLLPPGMSRKQEIDTIGTLTAYSFVSRQPTNTLLDLHRLVHLTTRNWLRQKGTLHEWTEETTNRIVEVLPEQGYEHEHRAIWRTYLPHAQHVLASDLVDRDGEQRIKLLWKYGRCLNSDGRWREADQIFSQILAAQRRVPSENSADDLAATSWLALTYMHQGRWAEAEQLQVEVLETYKRKLGADHPNTLSSMHNLALTYKDQGRLAEAEQLQIEVLKAQKIKLGTDHPKTLSSMNNLALTYSQQGRWVEAEQLQVQVLETWKTELGADHPHTLASMNNLASTYSDQGRWAEAEQLGV